MLRSIRARWAGAKTDNKRAVVGIICLIGVLSIVVIATVSEYQLIHSFEVIPIPEDRGPTRHWLHLIFIRGCNGHLEELLPIAPRPFASVDANGITCEWPYVSVFVDCHEQQKQTTVLLNNTPSTLIAKFLILFKECQLQSYELNIKYRYSNSSSCR